MINSTDKENTMTAYYAENTYGNCTIVRLPTDDAAARAFLAAEGARRNFRRATSDDLAHFGMFHGTVR